MKPIQTMLKRLWRIVGTPILLLLLTWCIGLSPAWSQMVIAPGTTFKVASGTTLLSAENLVVKSTATLNNAGTLVLKKNLLNENSAANSIGTGTAVFSGIANQSISGLNIIQNLTLNNTTGLTIGGNTNVNGTLTLTTGNVTLGSNNLLLGPTATVSGTPSATAMVVATGAGELRKEFSSAGTFTWPVGDATATPEYSPVSLTFSAGTFGTGNYAGVKLVNSAYTGSSVNYLNRYWTLTQNGITTPTYTATFQYLPADVNGIESQIYCKKVDAPTAIYGAANTTLHQLTASGLSVFGIFTGAQQSVTPPTIYNVTGGGSFCQGGNGVAIGLSGSQTGVNYTLLLNGTATTTVVSGNGSAITFGVQTASGSYTVTAMNTTTLATATMSSSAIVTVNSLPVVTWPTTIPAQCSNTTTYALTGALPAGGTYSGMGVTGTNFNPSVAGAGTFVITYTYTNANGCTNSATNQITVNATPTVTWPGTLVPKCVSATTYTLTGGTPAGGTYSGPGITGTNFNASVAGVGTHTITYSYMSNGCNGTATKTIVVNPLPVVEWTTALTPQCVIATTYVLSGATPAGGTYSGTGVTGTNFNASIAGVGTKTITYTYTNGNGCSNTKTNTITVYALPTVSWSNTLTAQCVSSATYALTGGLPAGGTYSGTGVTGTNFNASVAGMGTFTLTYSYSDANGCSGSTTNQITVHQPPIANAGIDQTIEIGNSATLSAIATGGSSPYSYSWGIGLNTQSIIVTPTSTTTYSVTVTDAFACAGTDEVVVNVTPLPSVLTTTAPTNTACPGEIIVPVSVSNFSGVAAISLKLSYDNAILTYTGYQNAHASLASGVLIINATNSKVQVAWFSISPATIGNGKLFDIKFTGIIGESSLIWNIVNPGDCEYKDFNSITIPADFVNGFVTIGNCSNLEGNMTYDNTVSTPMNNSTALLKQGANTVYQVTTDISGHFLFANLANGLYTTAGASSKAWGGVNASDALVILKYFVGQTTLTGIRLAAGDVDGSGYVNSSDALSAAKRFIGITNSFPVGDWVFEKFSVQINGTGNVTQNMKSLVFGDVDGSYIPGAKTEPAIYLENDRTISITGKSDIDIPVRIKNNSEVGSISLVLDIPDPSLKVKDVFTNSKGNIVFQQDGSSLRIAWYSLIPMQLKEDDILLTVKCSTVDPDLSQNSLWTVDPVSQITDANAKPYENLRLTMPKLTTVSDQFYLSQNAPNPFSDATEISYYLPERGTVSLVISDLLGRRVMTMVNTMQDTGLHKASVHASTLLPGIYTYTLLVNGETKEFTKTLKMIIER